MHVCFTPGSVQSRYALRLIAICAMVGVTMAAPAVAAPLHDPDAPRDNGEHHPHQHTHNPVDNAFRDDRPGQAAAAPAPAPAGDGYYWFKGNLHTHTLWSDGDQFPEVVVQWYAEHGYNFLALSDHNVLSRGEKWINPMTNRYIASGGRMDAVDLYRERFRDHWVQTRENESGELEVRLKPLNEFRHLFERAGEFILIESEEITQSSHGIHVNATNIAELIEPQTGESVEKTIRLNVDAVIDQGQAFGRPMLPHLNHPNFQWAVRAEDMIGVENLRFFEVYNGHRGVNNLGGRDRVDLDRMWDIVLTRRLAERGLGVVYGLAVDDAHHYEGSSSDVARPGRGWVMVRSRYLTPEHLIAALQRGDFYSTTGVVLRSIDVSHDAMTIHIEREDGVTYTTQFIGTRRGYDASTEPRLDRDGNPMNVTRRYSDDVGEVLLEVDGTSPRYEFEGDEVYVRAKVVSSTPHPNPFAPGEHETAWVQPVVVEHDLDN